MRIFFEQDPGGKQGWVVWRERQVRRRGPPAHGKARVLEGTYLGRAPPGQNN